VGVGAKEISCRTSERAWQFFREVLFSAEDLTAFSASGHRHHPFAR
jgi:hypothetical protein